MKRLLIASTTAIAVVISLTPAQANHSWAGFHWTRTSNSVTLTLVNSLTSDWDGYSSVAQSDWDVSPVLSFANQQGSEVSKDRKRCAAILGKIRECNQKYGFNGWLGVAQVWLYSGTTHIAQGTVKVNDSYFTTSTYNKPEWRQMVICQEIAHTFGLDHQDETFDNPNLGTCMDYTNNPLGPPSNVHPNQHDYDEIDIIYNHVDSSASAPSSGPGNGNHSDRQISRDGKYTVVTWILHAH